MGVKDTDPAFWLIYLKKSIVNLRFKGDCEISRRKSFKLNSNKMVNVDLHMNPDF